VIDEATIAKAVQLLQSAAPGANVMLFGSYATGTANAKSDLDLLVVEPQLGSRREETTRLKRALQPLGIPVDLIVVSQKTFDSWSQFPNAITALPAAPNRSYAAIRFGRPIWSMFGAPPPPPVSV
jgi:predicted nucleotidyltransferase